MNMLEKKLKAVVHLDVEKARRENTPLVKDISSDTWKIMLRYNPKLKNDTETSMHGLKVYFTIEKDNRIFINHTMEWYANNRSWRYYIDNWRELAFGVNKCDLSPFFMTSYKMDRNLSQELYIALCILLTSYLMVLITEKRNKYIEETDDSIVKPGDPDWTEPPQSVLDEAEEIEREWRKDEEEWDNHFKQNKRDNDNM